MNLKNIVAGIAVVQPYYDKPDGYHLSAEHDQIWLGGTQRPLSPEDVQKMIDLGWFQEDQTGEDTEFEAKHYNEHESWTTYV